MKRIAVMVTVVAILLCPLAASSGSCELDPESLPKARLSFDIEEVQVFDFGNKELMPQDVIELGDFLTIKSFSNNVWVFMDGQIIETNTMMCVDSSFFTDEIILIEVFSPISVSFDFKDENYGFTNPKTIGDVCFQDEIELPSLVIDDANIKWNVMKENETYTFLPGKMVVDYNFLKCLSDDSSNLILYGVWDYNLYETYLRIISGSINDNMWTKIDDNNYCAVYSKISDKPILPSVDDHWYEFINWYDEYGSIVENWDFELCKNKTLFANQKLKEFKINFYDRVDAVEPIGYNTLTKEYFQTPDVTNSYFAGWYYTDQNGTEQEFKEGVVLQDDMNVYAKYFEGSSSENIGLYHLLTENGIRISDNETVETVVASTIFVMLALGTFMFVFRRH